MAASPACETQGASDVDMYLGYGCLLMGVAMSILVRAGGLLDSEIVALRLLLI